VLSCGSSTQNKSENPSSKNSSTQAISLNGSKIIDLNNSKIHWKGYKILGNHTGTINLKEGNLEFDKGNMINGKFVVDMHSVKVTELMDEGEEEDDEEEEEESPEDDKNDLANHLINEDFFDAKKYPIASFSITKSSHTGNAYQITGNMTIKGITKEISFQAQLSDNQFKATIPIDRTKFGIKYGSGSFFSNLGDNIIKDNFDLVVALTFVEG
jgi:polyisoprenoid-binding protein YceI